MVDHEMLQDKPHRTVVRVGDTVRRPRQPWSASVHELLRYLESIDYPHSPRFLGIDDEGREVVSYIEGESGGDGWAKVVEEEGLIAMARRLREYHDVVRGFRPAAVDGWAGRPAPPDRRRRLEVFAAAYGLGSSEGLVDAVIAQLEAVWERARLLAGQGCQPQAGWQATGFLDTTGERIRWSRDNRRLFE